MDIGTVEKRGLPGAPGRGKAFGRMIAMSILCALLAGCGGAVSPSVAPESDGGQGTGASGGTGYTVIKPDSYDSADTCVLVGANANDRSVTFLNLEKGRRYTLTMDGTTRLADRYGEGIALNQIALGDIVDITFLKSSKHLTSMSLSQQGWKLEQVQKYEIDPVKREMNIGSSRYKLTEETMVISEGREASWMDLNPSDVLEVQGIDTSVLSITVRKGHGYLRMTGHENFVGGWLEVGQQVYPITEVMLLPVPEGTYEVSISHRNGGGVKTVTIERNEETVLDVSDFEVEEAQRGVVVFSVTPADASLYIDGERADISLPVQLEYGLHQLIVRKDGYQSITQYFRVGQPTGGIDIVLDRAETEDGEPAESGESVSGSDLQESSGYYKMYVDAPEGAEVYLDGSYIGVAPCSAQKVSGAHTVTLRRSGYTTRSYTIQVDEESRDTSFSFAELDRDNPYEDSTQDALDTMNEIMNSIWGF